MRSRSTARRASRPAVGELRRPAWRLWRWRPLPIGLVVVSPWRRRRRHHAPPSGPTTGHLEPPAPFYNGGRRRSRRFARTCAFEGTLRLRRRDISARAARSRRPSSWYPLAFEARLPDRRVRRRYQRHPRDREEPDTAATLAARICVARLPSSALFQHTPQELARRVAGRTPLSSGRRGGAVSIVFASLKKGLSKAICKLSRGESQTVGAQGGVPLARACHGFFFGPAGLAIPLVFAFAGCRADAARARARPTHTGTACSLYTLRTRRAKNAAHFDARGHKHENRQI